MSQCVSRNFPEIFGFFEVFLVPCKHFLEFPNLFLRWKIFRKKKQNLILPVWAEPEGPTRTRSGPAWPAKAHRPDKVVAFTSGGAAALGVRATQT
jgi:hypothetical protein